MPSESPIRVGISRHQPASSHLMIIKLLNYFVMMQASSASERHLNGHWTASEQDAPRILRMLPVDLEHCKINQKIMWECVFIKTLIKLSKTLSFCPSSSQWSVVKSSRTSRRIRCTGGVFPNAKWLWMLFKLLGDSCQCSLWLELKLNSEIDLSLSLSLFKVLKC